LRSILLFSLLLNIYPIFTITAQEATLKLSLEGNIPSQTSIIDSISYARTFADLNTLQNTLKTVTTQLIDKGYIDAEIQSLEKKDSVSYLGVLNVGHFYKFIRVRISDDAKLQDFVRQAGLEVEGNWIRIETAFAKALLEKLTSVASNNGNPFASFQLSNISKTKNNYLTAELLFTSKAKRTIDNIVIKGYEKFPRTFIKRYAGIKKGDTFNQEELLRQNSRLNALPFTKSTKEPEALFRKDSTTVYFYLEQASSNRFDGFLGFATDETTNNLRLDGYVDLQLTNNLNYGETLLLNFKSDGGDQSQLKASITLPYLFKSPLGIEAKLSLFRKDSTFSTTTQEANLLYRVSPNIRTGLGYQSIQSENLQDEFIEIASTEDYTSNKLVFSGEYLQTQDDYFFPVKSNVSLLSSMGNRRTDIAEQQVSAELTASTIINLNKNNVFYVRNITKSLWSDNFLTNELFRFGGITSIRGFEENSIFANFLSTLNTEYRYVFNQSLYLHSVIDLGYFENSINEEQLTLFSFGLGTGVRTKAGVLKIIIANGKNENQDFDFNNTKLHFQLAIRF